MLFCFLVPCYTYILFYYSINLPACNYVHIIILCIYNCKHYKIAKNKIVTKISLLYNDIVTKST